VKQKIGYACNDWFHLALVKLHVRSFPRSQLDSGTGKLDFFVENFLFVMTMTFMTTDL